MLLLTTTGHTLKLTTSSTANVDYTVSYADHTTTTFTPGNSQGTIASATTTTILTAPGASTQRQVKDITVRNRHASTGNTVSVIVDVSATQYIATSPMILSAGFTAYWSESTGWIIYDAAGLVKTGAVASSVAWGSITGTLSNQTDLQTELDSITALAMVL
jgi:hypothetical protein